MEEEFYDFALSRACFALSVGALIERCILFYYKNFWVDVQFLSSKFYSKISTIQSRFSALCFRMGKTFDCNKCGGHHIRPINRSCKNTKNNEQSIDTNAQILHELKSLSGCMSHMETKMESFSATVPSPARSSCSQRSPASTQGSRTPMKDLASTSEEDLILPTLSTLRQSRSIQEQVDTRIKELQAVDKEKGKFKSQRGGSETIWVKNEISWPHNFVLSGSSKTRVTYDSLSLSQWVSGFATIIKDENDLETKNKMLEYLAEIMEDSHDFGFSAAKGSHAVLLCRMEEGHITWNETHKIDRVRRAYDPLRNHKILMSRKNQVSKTHPCPAGTFKRMHVLTKLTMTSMAVHTYMSVVSVTPRVRQLPIHPRSVVKQKTSRALQKCRNAVPDTSDNNPVKTFNARHGHTW